MRGDKEQKTHNDKQQSHTRMRGDYNTPLLGTQPVVHNAAADFEANRQGECKVEEPVDSMLHALC
eukprot:m.358218 g.358218  ORF g.358218 m.358218 type:complete len:65 (-) comp18071_c0_seq1:1040-1234(-)